MKTSKLILYTIFSIAIAFMAGCSDDHTFTPDNANGGGTTGGGGGGTTTPPSSISISLTLKDGPNTTDNDVASISANSPGFITVRVTDQNGAAVENQIVSLSTGLANINPTTALTDVSGNAIATLEYLNSFGADQFLVTATLGTQDFTAARNYVVVAPSIQLGDNSGMAFVSGQLEINTPVLSAGGNTSIVAYLVDANENPFTTPIAVSFTSICAALVPPLATISPTVIAAGGIATASYQAGGCIGDDTITATAQFGGAQFTASGVITVASEQAGSVNFISATPENITLIGAGGAGLQETSEIKFQVVGASGQPLSGESVTFSVNGSAGGLTFSPATAITNINGEVTTVVQSGSIPLVVSITATVDSNGITTQSTGLVISAGLADDDSFTIGADKFNPEALRYNGEQVAITVHLADVFNNPPPVGTPVFFTTEGGSIGSNCDTDSTGRCTVQWISGNPRPGDFRATVLAYTQGVESFTDINGDGHLSNGETITADLPEVFRDNNENGSYDAGEFFVDFDNNGFYDIADGFYNGNLCNDTSGRCSAQTSLNISRDLVIVFSDSFANITASSGATTLADQNTNGLATLNVAGSTAGVDVDVTFSDTNGQPMPLGTTINVVSETSTLGGTTSFTQQTTSVAGTTQFTFTLKDSNLVTADTGRVTITVKTPKNNETVIYFTANE